jgi:hypothetical protein
MPDDPALAALRAAWQERWQPALADWSRFTKLADPRWCLTLADEQREALEGSFAMIRLAGHAVVVSLRQIRDRHLEGFARQVLAHEIGHHVYAPGDLRDNARLHARVRAGLPTRESFTGIVANLYTDLLVNDRLQRSAGLDMAAVYHALAPQDPGDRLWRLYLRIYEVLWSLPAGTLTPRAEDPRVELDATLGARLVRSYAQDWLRGAGRFAALLLPYLLELPAPDAARLRLPPWFDTDRAGASDAVPDGLAGIEKDEQDGAIHPAEDDDLAGVDGGREGREESPGGDAAGRAQKGGAKNPYRTPGAYRDLMKSVGVTVPDEELVNRYYRERAVPHLIRFPARQVREASDPLPEGLDTWDVGAGLHEIDWPETLSRSPRVIPGVTTVRRTYGTTDGSTPERAPVDLYVGIDCSGSMSNPAQALSYPVLAGTIVALSALRAGARVMVCLSGEPGGYAETRGFVRDEHAVLTTLTSYLGSGYAFGIARLQATFLEGARGASPAAGKPRRPVHLLVVSDDDIFMMLDRLKGGWDIAREALARAGGGGTFVLECDPRASQERIVRLEAVGWQVHAVRTQEEMVTFAQAFSRAKWEAAMPPPAGERAGVRGRS